MKRMTLVLLALTATGCTPETNATPTTVTQTVTDTKNTADGLPAGNPEPCTSLHLEAAVAPGEWPDPATWNTAIVLTNLGPDACTLDGTSELRFFTGGNGQQLDVQQVTTDDEVPADLVVLAAGEQGSMGMLVPTASTPTPDCLVGGAFVDVVLPGEDDVESAEAQLPPICGAVAVTSWSSGGAPGAAAN